MTRYGFYMGLGDDGGFRYDGNWKRFGFPINGNRNDDGDANIIGGVRGTPWVYGIISDVVSPNKVYCFGRDGSSPSGFDDAFFSSNDYGQTWTKRFNLVSADETWNSTLAAYNGSVYRISGEIIYRSTNDGASWTEIVNQHTGSEEIQDIESIAVGTTKLWYTWETFTTGQKHLGRCNFDGSGQTTIWSGSAGSPMAIRAFGDSFVLQPSTAGLLGVLTKITSAGVATNITPPGTLVDPANGMSAAGQVSDVWAISATTYICLTRAQSVVIPGYSDGAFDNEPASFILRTTDSGATWTLVQACYGHYSATSGGCGQLDDGSSGIAASPDCSDIYVIGQPGTDGIFQNDPNYINMPGRGAHPAVVWWSEDLGVTWTPIYHTDMPYTKDDGYWKFYDLWGLTLGPAMGTASTGTYEAPQPQWWGIGTNTGGVPAGLLGTGLAQSNLVEKPQLIAGIDFKKLVSSAVHCAGVDGSGRLWTWGNNSMGQLGLGDTVSRTMPTLVESLPYFVFDVAVGGSDANSAFTIAAVGGDGGTDSNVIIYHVGSNVDGTRDTGSRDGSPTPHTSWQSSTTMGAFNATDEVQLHATEHCAVCFIQSDDLWMIGWHGNPWPDGGGYQPSVWSSNWTYMDLCSILSECPSIGDISIGPTHALLRTREWEPDINVYHWGQQGAMDGTGRGLSGWDASPVVIPALSGIRSNIVAVNQGGGMMLSSGQGTTAQGPGYAASKQLYVWGTNSYGECGNGTTSPVATPIVYPVPGEPYYVPSDNPDARAVLCITNNGQYWASGDNTGSIICRHSEEPSGTSGHLVKVPTRGYVDKFGNRGSKGIVQAISPVGLIIHMALQPRMPLYTSSEDSVGMSFDPSGAAEDNRVQWAEVGISGGDPWDSSGFNAVGASRTGIGAYTIPDISYALWESRDYGRTWTRHVILDFDTYHWPDIWHVKSWVPGDIYVYQGRDASYLPDAGTRSGIYRSTDWGVSWTRIRPFPWTSTGYRDWQFGSMDLGTNRIWYSLEKQSGSGQPGQIWSCAADGSGNTMHTNSHATGGWVRALNDDFCITIKSYPFDSGAAAGVRCSLVTSGGAITDLLPSLQGTFGEMGQDMSDFVPWDVTIVNANTWLVAGALSGSVTTNNDNIYVLRTTNGGINYQLVLDVHQLEGFAILGTYTYQHIDNIPGTDEIWLNGNAGYLPSTQQSHWYSPDRGQTWVHRRNHAAIKTIENDLWVIGPGSLAAGNWAAPPPSGGGRSYVQILG